LLSVLAGHAALARLRFLPWVASLVAPPRVYLAIFERTGTVALLDR
jgi:hypothetical protein